MRMEVIMGDKMKILLISSLIVLASCAHHKDVRPKADGKHEIKILGESKQELARNAMKQANHYCEEDKKRAAIVSEKVTYVGQGSEDSYVKAKAVTKAVKAVGGSAYVFGGEKEKNAGGIGVLGGQAADAYLGDGYQMHMVFVCK